MRLRGAERGAELAADDAENRGQPAEGPANPPVHRAPRVQLVTKGLEEAVRRYCPERGPGAHLGQAVTEPGPQPLRLARQRVDLKRELAQLRGGIAEGSCSGAGAE